jgi:GT2 family glycosyltransferase
MSRHRRRSKEGGPQDSPAGVAAAPAVSVIVCTYRRAGYLPGLVQSLKAQTVPAEEILLVDNEASKETEAIVRDSAEQAGLAVRYLPEAQMGLSHARNRGLTEARGEILAFLDDDALPLPNWIDALRSGALRHPKAGVFAGPVELAPLAPVPPGLLEGAAQHLVWLGALDLGRADERLVNTPTHYRGPIGANMIFRRSAVLRAGVFDTRIGRKGASLLSGEDVVYVNAVRDLGFEVWYLADARVRHQVPQERLTERWFEQRAFWEGVSIARMACDDPSGGAARVAGFQGEKASGLAGVVRKLEAAGLRASGLPLGARITLMMILGQVVESGAAGRAAGAEARDLWRAIAARRAVLDLELPEEGARWFAEAL